MYIYIQLIYPILRVEHPLLTSRPADLDIPLWRSFQDVARKIRTSPGHQFRTSTGWSNRIFSENGLLLLVFNR